MNSGPVPEAAGAPPKPRIVVVVGLPGSGKSTYLESISAPTLSTDAMRALIADDPTDQSIHSRVFGAVRYLLRHRLEIGRPVTYVDATNLTRRERRSWIRLAELNGCEAEAIFFDVPLEVCMERNRARNRVVPEDVLRKMAAKLVPPALEEGFTRVTVVGRQNSGARIQEPEVRSLKAGALKPEVGGSHLSTDE